MIVKQILEAKGGDVATAAPSATIAHVVAMLAKRRIGAVVITGPDDRIVGIASERDVVRALDGEGPSVLESPVSTIMTRTVATCSQEASIADLMRQMTDGKFRHLPVVVGGKLAGIISIGDVVKYRLSELEHETNAMRDYIATA